MDDWTTYEDGLRCLDDLTGLVPVDEIACDAELSRLDERAAVYATLREVGMQPFLLQNA